MLAFKVIMNSSWRDTGAHTHEFLEELRPYGILEDSQLESFTLIKNAGSEAVCCLCFSDDPASYAAFESMYQNIREVDDWKDLTDCLNSLYVNLRSVFDDRLEIWGMSKLRTEMDLYGKTFFIHGDVAEIERACLALKLLL